MLLGAFRGGNPLERIVGKPEKCPRKRAMQLKQCRTSRLRAMLAIASFIAAFPTSHIMSEKPIVSVSVSRSGEQRGVRTRDNVTEIVASGADRVLARGAQTMYIE